MLNEQIVRLLSLMHIHPPSAKDAAGGNSIVKRLKFGKKRNSPKFGNLPESVWYVTFLHLLHRSFIVIIRKTIW